MNCHKIAALPVACFLLSVVTPVFSDSAAAKQDSWDWTKHQEKFYSRAENTITPGQYDWTVSAGVVIVDSTTKFPDFGIKGDGTAHGGYVGVEYFVTRPFSIRLELLATHDEGKAPVGQGNVISASLTQFVLDVGGKFYPLQLTKLAEFRVQPYLRAALGAVLYHVSVSGFSVTADPTLIGGGGGGLDVILTDDWSVTAEAGYFSTLIDSTLNIGPAKADFRQYGWLFNFGARYRF